MSLELATMGIPPSIFHNGAGRVNCSRAKREFMANEPRSVAGILCIWESRERIPVSYVRSGGEKEAGRAPCPITALNGARFEFMRPQQSMVHAYNS